jgi:HEAT repeat protein
LPEAEEIQMTLHSIESANTEKDRYYLGQPFEYWVRKFREADPNDRHPTARALASFGQRSIPCLVEALQFEDYEFLAREALKWMGKPAVSAVVSLFQSPNPFVRIRGLRLLKDLYHHVPGLARKLLCDTLGDGEPEVRVEAAKALRFLALPLAPPCVTALATAANDSNVEVRYWAVSALVYLDYTDEMGKAYPQEELDEGVECLLEALQDPDIAVRLEAAETLEEVKPNTKKVRDALNVALADPVEAVRIAAQEALKRLEADETDDPTEPDPIIIQED